MATAPNTSFIPKRGPVKRARQTASRQVHLLTIFSYILFCATLVATVAVFFYHRYIDDMRRQEISALNAAITSFNEDEMKRVIQLDSRLRQANQRLQNTVSVASIFDSLEQSTVQSARLTRMEIEREGDASFMLEAEMETESFDASLFQRGIFERNQIVQSVDVKEVELVVKEEGELEQEGIPSSIKFKAHLTVPLSAVLFNPQSTLEAAPVFENASSTATTSEDVSILNSDSQNTL